jgi:hypothetical protein
MSMPKQDAEFIKTLVAASASTEGDATRCRAKAVEPRFTALPYRPFPPTTSTEATRRKSTIRMGMAPLPR